MTDDPALIPHNHHLSELIKIVRPHVETAARAQVDSDIVELAASEEGLDALEFFDRCLHDEDSAEMFSLAVAHRDGLPRPEEAYESYVRRVTGRAADSIVRPWIHLVSAFARAKGGRLSPKDINEAMLPTLTLECSGIYATTAGNYGLCQADEAIKWAHDLTPYDGETRAILTACRQTLQLDPKRPLPEPLIKWLSEQGVDVVFTDD